MKSKKIYKDITETIGKTPLVRINHLTANLHLEILAKLEFFNPMGSIKDRIALAMIDAGVAQGVIDHDTVIIEPTSGNTGIALAGVCAARGLKLILTMPDSLSKERRKLLQLMGAQVILTPALEGMRGAINKAKEIYHRQPKAFMPNQFDNPANPLIHAHTTAMEILEDTDGDLDILIVGVGTGGTITGLTQTLRQTIAKLWVVAVEPDNSPILSGGMPGHHQIQGIGAGFIPKVLDIAMIDEVVRINDDLAFNTARQLAAKEGIACGISSGAAMAAALRIGQRLEFHNQRAVVILPDLADRYLTTPLCPS